ncbi:MAG: hypothetical protein HFI89_02865 [Lachnospiraceae bacterium]|nr:hypothetical protein [Lachnospiraceae bacterium]
MLKMVIQMNDNKINIEKKYCLDRISQTIDNIFAKMGLLRMEDAADSLVYRDSGHDKDYSQFKKNCKYLKKQPWFMENVMVWLLCESDDFDNPDNFSEEDLLNHYRQKQSMGG